MTALGKDWLTFPGYRSKFKVTKNQNSKKNWTQYLKNGWLDLNHILNNDAQAFGQKQINLLVRHFPICKKKSQLWGLSPLKQNSQDFFSYRCMTYNMHVGSCGLQNVSPEKNCVCYNTLVYIIIVHKPIYMYIGFKEVWKKMLLYIA